MNLSFGVKGEYEVCVIRGSGIKEEYAFSNMILDVFVDRWANSSGNLITSELSCYVGSGTTPPVASNTQLEAFIAKSPSDANISENYLNYKSGSDYWTEYFATFTYSLGQVVGNVSEVGIQMNNATKVHTNIDSRSLIKDASNNPITLVLTANDQLIVRYKLKFKIPTTQSSTVITIAGTSTTVTWECHNALDYRAWSIYNMMQFSSTQPSYLYLNNSTLINNPELDRPTANTKLVINPPTTGVKIGPGQRQYVFTIASSVIPNSGSFNYISFMPAIAFGSTGSYSQFGIHFSSPIFKTADQIFKLTYGVSLARL